MTLSKEVRKQYLGDALKILWKELKDRAVDSAFFDPSDPAFSGIPNTTWNELEEANLLVSDTALGRVLYRLTGEGWLETMHAADEYASQRTEADLARLAAYLKTKVNGRREPALVDIRSAAVESQLSEGWIFNTIESNFFELRWRRRGAHWHPNHRGRNILIPVTFGMEEVDPQAHLRAEVERLKEELEDREHRLSEYLCPYCSAPMTAQMGVPLTDNDEGLLVEYECGYSATDGETNHPCPSGPEFPAWEEYTFTYSEHPSEPYHKWTCQPLPQTKRAKTLRLSDGHGRTQEEALATVRQRYDRYAGRRGGGRP